MSRPFSDLTDLEKDSLAELSNIAMARAATSLRQMVDHQVLLSVPAVDIVSKEVAAKIIGTPPDRPLVAVRQDFNGPFSGRALLIFPERNSLELVRIIVGRELPLEDIGSLEDEALAETGNIILNSWIATLANLLKLSLRMSLPTVLRGDSNTMLTGTEAQTLVLFLHIKFEISAHRIQGYVALLMDLSSVDELRSLIAHFVSELNHDKP
jgi:chemotaxis protein CheC